MNFVNQPSSRLPICDQGGSVIYRIRPLIMGVEDQGTN